MIAVATARRTVQKGSENVEPTGMKTKMKTLFVDPFHITTAALVTAVATLGALPAIAQNPFSAAVTVNDSVVTFYEVDQRRLFLETVRTPGNLEEQALEDLVNERLQVQEAERLGLAATPEAIEAGVVEFAARADLGPEEFLETIAEEGVEPETFRDFVASGISWRNVVQNQFRGRVQISDDDVTEALALATSLDSVSIRLAEIIVPLTPQNEDTLRDEIELLAQDLDGQIEEFSEAASRFSAAPSREDGGLTDWRQLSELPPGLRDEFINLVPGQTAGPVVLGPAIGIFQLRGLRETALTRPPVALVNYATVPLPADPGAAAVLRDEIDVCDDLYGTRPGGFTRVEQPPREVPANIALALSTLDPGEISFDITDGFGGTLAVMKCGQTVVDEDELRADVRRRLFAEQLTSYGEGRLEELRSAAFIDFNP